MEDWTDKDDEQAAVWTKRSRRALRKYQRDGNPRTPRDVQHMLAAWAAAFGEYLTANGIDAADYFRGVACGMDENERKEQQ